MALPAESVAVIAESQTSITVVPAMVRCVVRPSAIWRVIPMVVDGGPIDADAMTVVPTVVVATMTHVSIAAMTIPAVAALSIR